jgi:hypothetical protein
MLWLADILIITLLLMVFVQDVKSRAVYWIVFPLLVVAFIFWQSIKQRSLTMPGYDVLFNLGFLMLQLLSLTIGFSFKQKQWVNITRGFLGWGDILLLVSLAFFFSFLNFFAFYMGSLLMVLLIWVISRQTLFRNSPHIPLAGLQALLFLMLFVISLLMPAVDLGSDRWILHILTL